MNTAQRHRVFACDGKGQERMSHPGGEENRI